jgi:hypothetical protein
MTNNLIDTGNVLSLIATTSSRIKDLIIEEGQLIFLQDLGRIAFDHDGKRIFYNQITELASESDRIALKEPLSGYYFVIDTATLWFYQDGWIQNTNKPEQIICIDVELPTLGQAKENLLYVNKSEKEIVIFDKQLNDYIIVSNFTNDVTDADIEDLFVY